MFNNNQPMLEHHQQHQPGSWSAQQPPPSFHPGSFTSPSSFGASSLAQMESTFCKNFVCCSIPLDDLHDLLEHYEQAHVCQSPPQNIPNDHNNNNKPDVVVFDDEDEWSGTESASTNPSRRATFDRSHSPPDHSTNHHWSTAPSSREQSTTAPSLSRRISPLNNWANIDNAFGIPPSLLDGQSHPARNPSTDPIESQQQQQQQHLLMMIDADEDGSSSSIDSDRNIDNPPRSQPSTTKRKLGPEQRDWESNREKPFKCTVPGCEKAYKQPNGLKYHKTHGHCAQKNPYC